MSAFTVRRTLIRSTPELWAEVSDVAALGRHLGEFGEIRITRLEEEAAVAWESELATGMVTLEASGLGTRVTLTAAPFASPPPPPVAQPTPDPPIASAPAPAPAPAPSGQPAVIRPVLFGRRHSDRPRLLDRLRARPRLAEALNRDEPLPHPPAAPIPLPVRPAPPAAPGPEPAAATTIGNGARAQPGFDRDRATEVLTGVLDSLGAARHRPFGAA